MLLGNIIKNIVFWFQIDYNVKYARIHEHANNSHREVKMIQVLISPCNLNIRFIQSATS